MLSDEYTLNQDLTDDRLLQRFALVTFYYSTNGENWDGDENWVTPMTHECEWTGVSGCQVGSLFVDYDAPARIKSLLRAVHHLSGPVPPEIGHLTLLRSLELSSNALTSIPSELGMLTQLTLLYLSRTCIGDDVSNLPVQVQLLRTQWDVYIFMSYDYFLCKS
jgi:hypothetical protein